MLRFILSNDRIERMGMKSLKRERYEKCLKYCSGYLLDIGSWDNELVNMYNGEGVGIDVISMGGGTMVLEDCSKTPFDDKSFDTISCIASIDHIDNNKEVVKEMSRLLKDDGQVIITVLHPIIGSIRHLLAYWTPKQKGERHGMSHKKLIELMSGFKLYKKERFVYKINCLYIFKII